MPGWRQLLRFDFRRRSRRRGLRLGEGVGTCGVEDAGEDEEGECEEGGDDGAADVGGDPTALGDGDDGTVRDQTTFLHGDNN